MHYNNYFDVSMKPLSLRDVYVLLFNESLLVDINLSNILDTKIISLRIKNTAITNILIS